MRDDDRTALWAAVGASIIWLASLLLMAFALSGCAGEPIYKPVDVSVPVSIPCRAPQVDKPASQLDRLTPAASIFEKTRALLIDRELSKGYEAQLDAAAKACR